MERVPLSSRVVRSAGYDSATEVLELEFTSGRIYQFQAVPRGTYEWLLRTPSKGAFVTRMINDRYEYREVTPSRPEATQDLAAALSASLREHEDE